MPDVEEREYLPVVAYAVEEKICRRGDLSTDGDLIAVAFTLVDLDSRHVFGHIADALEALVLICWSVTTLTDWGTLRKGVSVLVAVGVRVAS